MTTNQQKSSRKRRPNKAPKEAVQSKVAFSKSALRGMIVVRNNIVGRPPLKESANRTDIEAIKDSVWANLLSGEANTLEDKLYWVGAGILAAYNLGRYGPANPQQVPNQTHTNIQQNTTQH